jgi:uncharacterized membrane protein
MNKNENREIKTDIMRYLGNSLSFWLCVLAICFDVAMFIMIYTNKRCTANYQLGFDLLINVIFMLACFLLAEKTKVYSKQAGIGCFVVGGIQILRIFWIPLYYYRCQLAYLRAQQSGTTYTGVIGLTSSQFTWVVILYILSAACLIAAGLICNLKAKRLEEHLAKQGVKR